MINLQRSCQLALMMISSNAKFGIKKCLGKKIMLLMAFCVSLLIKQQRKLILSSKGNACI
jgi:hypothetical protein